MSGCSRCGKLEDDHFAEAHNFQREAEPDPDLNVDDMVEPADCGGICFWCGGDGWEECRDPIQCTSPHNEYGECRCASCGGSGLAKDMTIW